MIPFCKNCKNQTEEDEEFCNEKCLKEYLEKKDINIDEIDMERKIKKTPKIAEIIFKNTSKKVEQINKEVEEPIELKPKENIIKKIKNLIPKRNPEQEESPSEPEEEPPVKEPKPKNSSPKKNLKFVLIILTIFFLLEIVFLGAWGIYAYSNKDQSINVNVPENPTNNQYTNNFPLNNTYIINVDLNGELNKTISDAVKFAISQLNLTNSTG